MDEIVLVGTGSLSREILCRSNCGPHPTPSILVVGRSKASIDDFERRVGNAARSTFRTVCVDVLSAASMAAVLDDAKPSVVVTCASLHSPWERAARPSAWTDLVYKAGFGITTPLQAAVARSVALAIGMASLPSVHLNACFPDAVNGLLAGHGAPILCGIGNIATVSGFLRRAGLPANGTLRVLAHHVHLRGAAREAGDALAWVDADPVSDVGHHLREMRRRTGRDLNGFAAEEAVHLIDCLRTNGTGRFAVPGPQGLPGGYPVHIDGGSLSLDLPPGLDRRSAIDANTRFGRTDGLERVGGGTISLTAHALSEIGKVTVGYPKDIAFSAIDDAIDALTSIRGVLREAPAADIALHDSS